MTPNDGVGCLTWYTEIPMGLHESELYCLECPHTSCVSFNKLLSVSEPGFLHWKSEIVDPQRLM